MEYKGYTLDKFQVEAIESLERNHSVVVSAATGTGKTLIADYVIDMSMEAGKRVFYTAPIKALTNQKYKDFKASYGEEKVGIMTGDVVINPTAPVVVMTTEIYRNMLMVNDPMLQDLSYIVFDEIHFINDIERGVVWEESLIFSGEHVRFLCLSATIPNARQFADWIASIKDHDVDVVRYDKRAVPLTHLFYDAHIGICTADELEETLDDPRLAPPRGKQRKKHREKLASHVDLIRDIRSFGLPAIFFVFSRKNCEAKARELAKAFDFPGQEQKQRITEIYSRYMKPDLKRMQSAQSLRAVINKGIAYHHAGMLPDLKNVVEHLFAEGLIKVLYATETFAVGINMPAKTVCFNAVQKFDGISFRYFNSKEYFQMAGRAGRRGIDKEGTSIIVYDRRSDSLEKIRQFSEADREPIISQFKLSINTIINLINNHDDSEIETILKSNFDYFLRKQGSKQVRILASWNHKKRMLEKMGYVKNDELTEKGWFVRHIYANEILIAEIFATDLYKRLSDMEALLVVVAIAYEGRRGDRFYGIRKEFPTSDRIFKKLSNNQYVMKNLNKRHLNNVIRITKAWANGATFEELFEYSTLEEGDLIRLFRQSIDLLRQLKKASMTEELRQLASDSIAKLDRDVVKVEL